MSNYLRVLKKYGFIIEDDEGWVENLKRIPNKKQGETFKRWKIRVFGEDVQGLRIYQPVEPDPRTRMTTLSAEGGSDYLIWAFKNYRAMAEEEAKLAFQKTEDEIVEKFTTVPKELLEGIVDEYSEDLARISHEKAA